MSGAGGVAGAAEGAGAASAGALPEVGGSAAASVMRGFYGEQRICPVRPASQPALRSRSELATTMTLEHAIAPPAIIGLSIPAMASGIAATL